MKRRAFWPLVILFDFLILTMTPPNQPKSYYVLAGLVAVAFAWLLSED